MFNSALKNIGINKVPPVILLISFSMTLTPLPGIFFAVLESVHFCSWKSVQLHLVLIVVYAYLNCSISPFIPHFFHACVHSKKGSEQSVFDTLCFDPFAYLPGLIPSEMRP